MSFHALRAIPSLRRKAVRLAAALAALGLVPACDNPACVFGPAGCTGTSGDSAAANPATTPQNHQWVELGAPSVLSRIPSAGATQLGVDSPVALVFSESMSAGSLLGALRLQTSGGGFAGPVPTSTALVGDGRVAVVVPQQALTLDTTYDLVWTDNAKPVDLQGQALAIPTDKIAASFTVATTAPPTVRVLGSFPADHALNQSGVGELVVLFDRKLNPTSITPTSFDVLVDGVQPQFDPLPQPLAITVGGATVSDTRVYRWRSVDGAGNAVPLGAGLQVDLSLSPVGSKIAAVDGSQLAPLHVHYDIAAISPALSAEIVSMPMDAIGIDNVSGPKTLDIAVTLSSAVIGDRLGIFVFGNSTGANPKLVALFRDVALTTTATVVHIGEAELDLATDQGVGRLADGLLTFAIRMQRGQVTTPVRLLDADFTVPGVQPAVFDTVRPTLIGLGTSGTSSTTFSSDLRDFSLVGRASERIRAVEVNTALGNNGTLTPVVGSTPTGLFVAAPVLLGNLDPSQQPLAFTATLFDNALNSAVLPISASFTQLGASGPGAALPGPSITVQVFDSATLAPVPNARVMVHEDIGGGTVLPVDSGMTDAAGNVTLSAGFVGETLVTVDASGFDLFTFEDVPTDRLHVPLVRTTALPASVGGIVSSENATFSTFERSVVDSRRFPQSEPLIPAQSCTVNPVTQDTECSFGPSLIRPNLLGVATLLALEIPPSELSYNALSFLRAFQIGIPVAPALGGGLSAVTLAANTLLSDSGVDPEERAIDGPAPVLDIGATGGIAAGSLLGDPRILIEAQVRGLPGEAGAGAGIAFSSGGSTWQLRCAYPGAVDGIQDTPQDLLGRLVQSGALDPDLRLSCEVRDTLGARAGRRPRFSQIGATIEPVSAPVILFPTPGGNSGGATFDLLVSNAIPDSAGTPGMYRATLATVPSGRRWTLWRPDLDDGSGPTRTIHVPDLAALGGTALPGGSLSVVVDAFGYATFDPADFLWSDIEREYDAFSSSVPIAFTQP